jgi:hypothetical protein
VMKMGRKELREEGALVRSSARVVAPSSSFDIPLPLTALCAVARGRTLDWPYDIERLLMPSSLSALLDGKSRARDMMLEPGR